MSKPAFGANPSPYDIRTFAYPTKAIYIDKGGSRYSVADIENQSKVGICTAISITQNARKALGKKFSADFQYLMQKREYDKNWDEGSSIFHALKVAYGIGLLPQEEMDKWVTLADRDLPYHEYIKKLQAIPDAEIERLKLIAGSYKIKAYSVVNTDRDSLAEAINSSAAGVLTRYNVGTEWWTDKDGNPTWNKDLLQPLRAPAQVVSGHAVTDSNFDGGSFRIANTWSGDWCDGGTAYRLHAQYKPTEAWAIFYNELPKEIENQIESRDTIIGQILDLLQKIVVLVTKLK
jgi:hypothetical protein